MWKDKDKEYVKVVVSILVLMDLAFEYHKRFCRAHRRRSFNPCFNGSCIRIFDRETGLTTERRFNPCFNGSCIRIEILDEQGV
mgnify:CR=1 FL=1